MSFTKVSSASSADVVVQGYYSGGKDRCENAKAVACVVRGSGQAYPHLNRQQTFYFEYEPKSVDINNNILSFDWENDFTIAESDPTRLYMPIYMTHEFGHTAGLGHSHGASDVMNAGIAYNTQNLNSNDKKAMKAIYDNHTSH